MPPPLPEAQLALLPVHVHRSPVKKAKGRPGPQPEAAPATPQKKRVDAGRPAQQPAQQAQPVLHVPVLVEAHAPALPMLRVGSGSSLPKAAPAAGVAGGGLCCGGGEIRAAYPCAAAASEIAPAGAAAVEGGAEEEQPLCSICLEPFEDGVRVGGAWGVGWGVGLGGLGVREGRRGGLGDIVVSRSLSRQRQHERPSQLAVRGYGSEARRPVESQSACGKPCWLLCGVPRTCWLPSPPPLAASPTRRACWPLVAPAGAEPALPT